MSASDERRLVASYVAGVSKRELAARYGISAWAVNARLVKAGVEIRDREEGKRLAPGGRPPTPARPCSNCGAVGKLPGKGRCSPCLQWFDRHGFERPEMMWDPVVRFWSKVDVRRWNQCWEWRGYRTKDGYGRVHMDGTVRIAHRVAWELTNGPIPDGLDALHHCDNPPCCNARHLFLGDHAANMADMKTKGRARSGGVSGERVGTAKLTRAQVRAIRVQAASGARQCDLARQYGVHQSTISGVVRGRTWAKTI